MTTFLWVIVSTTSISLLAWVGLLTLVFNEWILRRALLLLVAFAAGTLMGVSVLHLIPEAACGGAEFYPMVWVLAGFSVMLASEQFLHWHHSHDTGTHAKPVAYMVLVADGFHNMVDGLAIAAAFSAGVQTGIAAWLASAAHEIPQELGDFGVLVNGGWTRRKALVFNFASALSVVPAGVLGLLFSHRVNHHVLLSFAAGNFIYIAASDLIPEIKQSVGFSSAVARFLSFAFGIAVMFAAGILSR